MAPYVPPPLKSHTTRDNYRRYGSYDVRPWLEAEARADRRALWLIRALVVVGCVTVVAAINYLAQHL